MLYTQARHHSPGHLQCKTHNLNACAPTSLHGQNRQYRRLQKRTKGNPANRHMCRPSSKQAGSRFSVPAKHVRASQRSAAHEQHAGRASPAPATASGSSSSSCSPESPRRWRNHAVAGAMAAPARRRRAVRAVPAARWCQLRRARSQLMCRSQLAEAPRRCVPVLCLACCDLHRRAAVCVHWDSQSETLDPRRVRHVSGRCMCCVQIFRQLFGGGIRPGASAGAGNLRR